MSRFPSFRTAPSLRGLLLATLATTSLACQSTPTPATETSATATPADEAPAAEAPAAEAPAAEAPAAEAPAAEAPAAEAPAAEAPTSAPTAVPADGATSQPTDGAAAPTTQPTAGDDHAGHEHAADPAAGGGMDHGLAEGTYDPADVVAQPGAQIGQLARCPISGEVFRVEETSAYYDHEEQRVYFCCASCIRRFQRDPSQYL